MDNFDNWFVNGIHTSRYVASWICAGGQLFGSRRNDYKFIKWLESLEINGRHLTEEEIDHIEKFASSGKLELEESAKQFLKGA